MNGMVITRSVGQRRPRRAFAALVGFALLGTVLVACGGSDGETSTTTGSSNTTPAPAASGPSVLASTSWVGAIAKMAGASTVDVVAPANLQHPPDYDPKPSDLVKASTADYVLLAGFEGFATRLKDAAGSDAKVETVMTAYTPEVLSKEVLRLAGEWGTTDVATANLEKYTADWNAASASTIAKLQSSSVVVVAQAYVAEWAMFAGLTPAGTYGMKNMPTPSEVADLVKLKPAFVFENSHMPMGADVASASGAEVVSIVNFPEADLDLSAVIAKNEAAILQALGR